MGTGSRAARDPAPTLNTAFPQSMGQRPQGYDAELKMAVDVPRQILEAKTQEAYCITRQLLRENKLSLCITAM
ncbi:hypothetical protein NDU88_006367 [Pleurodeles waltl]|uniref:Uncharacterized protein n=1 Tax=Pleurodeles waltl TaxID=8319 RepID=A0AAV7MC13_PLEWA|nr:hypothetical protein NDU88_006367 [Pleurodeles waltl]